MTEVLDPSTVIRRPPTSLRLLAGAVWLSLPLLLILTLVTAVYTIGKGGFGADQLFVDGWTHAIVVEHVPPSGTMQRHDLAERTSDLASSDISETGVIFKSVSARAEVSGTAPRLLVIVVALLKVAFGWFAWINLRGVTRSSLRGEVFTLANSSRLARLGVAALAFPISVWFFGDSVFNSVITDEQVGVSGFRVDEGVDRWFVWIGAGLLLLTVSRAFRWGVELQELEAATI